MTEHMEDRPKLVLGHGEGQDGPRMVMRDGMDNGAGCIDRAMDGPFGIESAAAGFTHLLSVQRLFDDVFTRYQLRASRAGQEVAVRIDGMADADMAETVLARILFAMTSCCVWPNRSGFCPTLDFLPCCDLDAVRPSVQTALRDLSSAICEALSLLIASRTIGCKPLPVNRPRRSAVAASETPISGHLKHLFYICF